MQLILRTTFLFASLMFALLSSGQYVAAAENKTVMLDVPGMTCNFCPITIRKALNKVPGVIEAKSDYETKSATVTFDPVITTIEALIKATANAGYPSTLKK